jgi:hypothetical protein
MPGWAHAAVAARARVRIPIRLINLPNFFMVLSSLNQLVMVRPE